MATVMTTRGSTPRDSGTKMLITENETFDTLGGGALEFQVILKARELLIAGISQQLIEHIPLSVKAKQCCGGTVDVLMEVFPAAKMNLHIFGAGHVAKALVSIIGQLDARVTWIDNRSYEFPDSLPENVQSQHYKNVIEHIDRMPPSSYALIMTHDHALDYSILEKLLDRKDCHYIGLIGSKTKALRFRKRLRSQSFTQEQIDFVQCPVGLPNIPGKLPMEIAVSICAQLIQTYSKALGATTTSKCLPWADMKYLLENNSKASTTTTDER